MVPREDRFTEALQDVARDVLSALPGDDTKGSVPPSDSEVATFVSALGGSLKRRGLKIVTLTVVEADLRSAEREGRAL